MAQWKTQRKTTAEPSMDDVGVIYNATLIEPALDKGDCIVEDDSSFWGAKDSHEETFCAFEVFSTIATNPQV